MEYMATFIFNEDLCHDRLVYPRTSRAEWDGYSDGLPLRERPAVYINSLRLTRARYSLAIISIN